MANTYTQIYIHSVFAVQGRQNLNHSAKMSPLACGVTFSG